MTTSGPTNLPDSPYGITLYVDPNQGNPAQLNQLLLNDLVKMAGQGVWLRYQLEWLSIETAPPVNGVPQYDFTSVFDDAVQKCNATGVNMCWNIQSPPVWRQSVDPSTGNVLPGNGTTCNTTLAAPITAGVTPSPAADGNAVISVVALPAGQSLTTGQIIGLGLGKKTQKATETVVSFANYGPGTTHIKVTDTSNNVWVPQNSFAGPTQTTVGAPVLNAGGVLENATDTARFGKDVATRYNGQNGHGFIAAFQIGNEEFDAYNPRDDQGKWLAVVAQSAAPAIRAAHPTCRIGVCSVRKTPQKGLAHIQAWLNNLYTYNGGIPKANINWLDYHFYRDNASAGSDPNAQDNNCPSVVTEVKTIQQIAAQYGHSPEVWCAETGWNAYDDGTGQITTLGTAVTTGGGPYTQVSIASGGLANFTTVGSQIYIDYGNANQEVLYTNATFSKGTTAISISSVFSPNTSWTPSSNHAAGCPVYIPVANIDGATNYATYLKAMYDGMRQNGGDKVLIFSMVRASRVQSYTGGNAGPNAVYAIEQKSITQTIGGTLTYLAPYTMTQAYAQKYPTWNGGSTGGTNQDVLSSRFNLQSSPRFRKLFSRFNLSLASVTQAKRLLSARYKLLALNKQVLFSRFNLQGASTSRIRLLASRYRLRGVLATLTLPGRIKLLPESTIALPPPPDALPSFFTAPTTAVRFGIGTYQSLPGTATKTIDGGFHFQPGVVFHPYAGNYGGTYGYLLDTTIKQPQQTQYTPATEIGLDASGVSVVRGFPQITWSYTTMRPDYWYYLQQVFRQAGKAPPGFQYLVLIQYPANDGSNTAVQQLARMNPPTFNYRSVAAFYGVSLLFQYVNAAQLAQTVPIVLLSP